MRFAEQRGPSLASILAVALLIAGVCAPCPAVWAQVGQWQSQSFVVDAATEWNETGILLLPGDEFQISADATTRQWSYAQDAVMFGASGDVQSGLRDGTKIPDATWGALVLRIGEQSMAATRGRMSVDGSGLLAFGMNDITGRFPDNRGSLRVTVRYLQRPLVMPALVGVPEADAIEQLRKIGFAAAVVHGPSDEQPAGLVSTQAPDPGTDLRSPQEIRLVVSNGPGPTQWVKVPVVIEELEITARKILATAQLQATSGGTEISSQTPGTVTRTEPQAGTQVVRDSEVKYWVAVPGGGDATGVDSIGSESTGGESTGGQSTGDDSNGGESTDDGSTGDPEKWVPWIIGCGVLVGVGIYLDRRRRRRMGPTTPSVPSEPSAEEPGVPADFSGKFHLPATADIAFASEPDRKAPDQTVSVVIKPGETQFLTPIPIEKIEVRHD